MVFIFYRYTEEDDEEVEIADFDIEGFSKPKKMVHFNGDGQPVGEGSISFVSYLGSVTRKHCPISYEHWKDVPDQIKVMIWKLVTDDYTISLTYKTQILQRINKQWREFKSKLRSKHYDKCDTDLERIRNCPGGVRHKDWVIFVGNQSTPNAQACRSKGKSAREALKTPHTYGRRGAARTNKAMAERSVSLSHQKKRSASPKVPRLSAARSEDLGPFKQKKVVYFNDDGQPVGEGSVSFTSNLGSLTRRHCPITNEQWRDVPDQIWKCVTDRYIFTARFKEQILKKVSKHWRAFKSHLQSKYFDRYNIDEERKRNCPQGVRSKDWSIFVDNQSTPDAQARRRRGKSAREAMKTPHKSGNSKNSRGIEKMAFPAEELVNAVVPSSSCLEVERHTVQGINFNG